MVPLLREAIGGRAVEILTSARQQTERGLDIATKMRYSATIPDALAMKHEDGDLHIVAGGPAATVKHAAKQYMDRIAEHRDDPSYALTMLTMTNAAAPSSRNYKPPAPRDGPLVALVIPDAHALFRQSAHRDDIAVACQDPLAAGVSAS